MEAICRLDEAFQQNGFDGTPPGLANILRRTKPGTKQNPNESLEECRGRLFRRFGGILWYGNGMGKGAFRGKALPTYVYPHCIKTAVRDVIGGELGDFPDPEGSAVYHVSVKEFHEAKWPGTTK